MHKRNRVANAGTVDRVEDALGFCIEGGLGWAESCEKAGTTKSTVRVYATNAIARQDDDEKRARWQRWCEDEGLIVDQ